MPVVPICSDTSMLRLPEGSVVCPIRQKVTGLPSGSLPHSPEVVPMPYLRTVPRQETLVLGSKKAM